MLCDENNLIWIDLEMTGLEPRSDKILEIATIITDSALNILAIGPELVIEQPEVVLAGMDEWNTRQHTQSGLVERIRLQGIPLANAEQMTIDFLKQHVPAGKSPMCGNSICQDRRFIYEYMPKLEQYFHYRHLDVSTLKILAQRWAPQLMDRVEKNSKHRAKDDILDSIEELRFYRENFIQLR